MWLNKFEMQEWAYIQCDEHSELRDDLKHLITIPFFALRYCQNIENDPVIRRKITFMCLLDNSYFDSDFPLEWFENVKYGKNFIVKTIFSIIIITLFPPIFLLWLCSKCKEMYLDYKLKD